MAGAAVPTGAQADLHPGTVRTSVRFGDFPSRFQPYRATDARSDDACSHRMYMRHVKTDLDDVAASAFGNGGVGAKRHLTSEHSGIDHAEGPTSKRSRSEAFLA